MIKARSRKISMLLVLAMLMTMFVGVGTASAANAEYSVPSVPSITEGNAKALGTIFVTIDESSMLGSGQWLLVALPSGVKINVYDVNVVKGNIAIAGASKSSDRSLEIFVTETGSGEASFKIDITADIENVSGELAAILASPAGTFFPRAQVTLANVVGSTGEAAASIQGVKTIAEGADKALDVITIEEKTNGTITPGSVLKLELPKGFTWSTDDVSVKGAWGFVGKDLDVTTDLEKDDRVLVINFGANMEVSAGTPGRVALGNDAAKKLYVDVEDNAKLGEVEAKLTLKNGNGKTVLSTNLVVANYADFGVKVYEDEVKKLVAGSYDVSLGTFVIEEGVAGSVLPNRTIILDLPSGVKWIVDSNNELVSGKEPNINRKKGSTDLLNGAFSAITSSKGKSIRLVTGNASQSAVKAIIEDMKVKVDPDFEGDVVITVRGTAGVEGTVKVAEVIKPVKVETSAASDVVIGQANQKAANIVITENDVEAIMADSSNNTIIFELENGVKFSSKPTVKVTAGDLEIDSSKLIWNDTALQIKVKYASSKEASTIEISDVYLTVDRTVPVGPIKAYIADAQSNSGNSALDETNSDKSPANVVIANVITPAAGGGVAEFRIGSNIYYVGGVAKVMDVAPYIKGDRTYVPMRYVAEMLGAEVVWDDAARTVTLTKGENVAVFTISSTTYTVNGEAMTADVAPEIANARTMLPARYVAEAFGALVGWDATTQTVLVQQ